MRCAIRCSYGRVKYEFEFYTIQNNDNYLLSEYYYKVDNTM